VPGNSFTTRLLLETNGDPPSLTKTEVTLTPEQQLIRTSYLPLGKSNEKIPVSLVLQPTILLWVTLRESKSWRRTSG